MENLPFKKGAGNSCSERQKNKELSETYIKMAHPWVTNGHTVLWSCDAVACLVLHGLANSGGYECSLL